MALEFLEDYSTKKKGDRIDNLPESLKAHLIEKKVIRVVTVEKVEKAIRQTKEDKTPSRKK